MSASSLRLEADTLEAIYGPNAYSFYLRKFGGRPSPGRARTIGLLMGGRVKASDGRMYPPISEAQRDLRRKIREERRRDREASVRVELIRSWIIAFDFDLRVVANDDSRPARAR